MAIRKRNKNLNPLPEGVAVGDYVSFYLNGWRTGRLDKIEGNEVGLHLENYLHTKGRLKWVPVTDIKRIEQGKDAATKS